MKYIPDPLQGDLFDVFKLEYSLEPQGPVSRASSQVQNRTFSLSDPLNKLQTTYYSEKYGGVTTFLLLDGQILSKHGDVIFYRVNVNVESQEAHRNLEIYFSIDTNRNEIIYNKSCFFSEDSNQTDLLEYPILELISEITGMKIWEYFITKSKSKSPFEDIIINGEVYRIKKISSDRGRAILDLGDTKVTFNPQLDSLDLKVYRKSKKCRVSKGEYRGFCHLARYLRNNRKELGLSCCYKAFKY